MPEWLGALATSSPAVILGFMWFLERTERLKEREEHKTIARDMIEAMVKTENTLATFGSVFTGRPSP